ncbi:MAG: DUF1080 domain-containing protein [Verrucomicrobiales bacterium]|nr:DUF1080 domain-containing protein [Verrucomicrobiales bacterium]
MLTFHLKLQYKLSEGANSGIFYRSDPTNPVQNGFEIQPMDNEGFQKTHGIKDARKLNGSFYDGKAPSSNPAKPVGEWNDFELECVGPRIKVTINKVQVIDVNVDNWDTAGKNPDGTTDNLKPPSKICPAKVTLAYRIMVRKSGSAKFRFFPNRARIAVFSF